jgi:hypothetical protein
MQHRCGSRVTDQGLARVHARLDLVYNTCVVPLRKRSKSSQLNCFLSVECGLNESFTHNRIWIVNQLIDGGYINVGLIVVFEIVVRTGSNAAPGQKADSAFDPHFLYSVSISNAIENAVS